MNGRLFALDGESCASEGALVTIAAIAVFDRGLLADRGERFEAQLAGYAVVQARGGSAWEAVRRLVGSHRALLERRWSGGVGP